MQLQMEHTIENVLTSKTVLYLTAERINIKIKNLNIAVSHLKMHLQHKERRFYHHTYEKCCQEKTLAIIIINIAYLNDRRDNFIDFLVVLLHFRVFLPNVLKKQHALWKITSLLWSVRLGPCTQLAVFKV